MAVWLVRAALRFLDASDREVAIPVAVLAQAAAAKRVVRPEAAPR